MAYHLRAAILIAGAALAAGTISPAAAQDRDQRRACYDNHNIYSLDLQIGGCTALIQSGTLSTSNLEDVFYNRAFTYDAQKDYPRAFADYSEVIRINPQNALAFRKRGRVGLLQRRFQDAWNDYDASLRINADYADALYGRGYAAKQLGRAEAGARDMADAVRIDPEVAKGYSFLP